MFWLCMVSVMIVIFLSCIDLLQTLEKFLNTLSQCQSVLLQYVQCKSARCPWLYFLTLEDALQLVCYSELSYYEVYASVSNQSSQ